MTKASKYRPVEIFPQQIKGKYKILILIQLKYSKKCYNKIRQKFPDDGYWIMICTGTLLSFC
jgi:DNA-binding HxlR family transcriptional regulator